MTKRRLHPTTRALSTIATMIVFASASSLAACSDDADSSSARPSRNSQDPGSPGVLRKEPTPSEDMTNLFPNGDAGASSSGPSNGTCASSVAALEKQPVDVVFIIDNSGSMTSEIAEVRKNINTFANTIAASSIDMRVTMLSRQATSSTSLGSNSVCVPEPLAAANCKDRLPAFRHIDQFIDSNDGLVRFKSALDTKKLDLRPEATKVIVMVTDDNPNIAAATFDSQLLGSNYNGLFGTAASRKYVYHSIVGWKEGTGLSDASKCTSAAANGMEHRKLSQLTGGLIESVCKTDYSSVLSNLAKGIAERQACQLPVPTGNGTDPSKFAVRISTPSGTPTALERVTDASKCTAFPQAWYFDNNDNPKTVLLCAGACGTVREKTSSKMEALVGCAAPLPR